MKTQTNEVGMFLKSICTAKTYFRVLCFLWYKIVGLLIDLKSSDLRKVYLGLQNNLLLTLLLRFPIKVLKNVFPFVNLDNPCDYITIPYQFPLTKTFGKALNPHICEQCTLVKCGHFFNQESKIL